MQEEALPLGASRFNTPKLFHELLSLSTQQKFTDSSTSEASLFFGTEEATHFLLGMFFNFDSQIIIIQLK